MKNPHKILGLVLICLSLSVVYSYADSVFGTMWKQEDTVVYPADDVTKVDFNNISTVNMLGAGSDCTTDCTFDNVSTGTLTAGRVDAGLGVFTNTSTVNSWASTSLYSPLLKNLAGSLSISTAVSPGDYTFSITDPVSGSGAFFFSTFGDFVADKKEWILTHTASEQQNITGTYIMMSIEPKYNQTIAPNDSANTDLAISRTETSIGSGEQSYIKATGGARTFRIDRDAHVEISGVYTAFRNLSSAAETLTSADYFVACLANDNVVTMTMPPIDASYSQTLMVKYTDSGSTNKCKLDGNGAEQVEGFDVYSGLDTYLKGVVLKSDGSAWWITGGI